MQGVTITLDDDLMADLDRIIAARGYHVHLDEENCLEVTVLKGRGAEVQSFANQVIAERGVRHGHAVYVPAPDGVVHSHGHSHPPKRTRTRTRS